MARTSRRSILAAVAVAKMNTAAGAGSFLWASDAPPGDSSSLSHPSSITCWQAARPPGWTLPHWYPKSGGKTTTTAAAQTA